MDEKLTKITWPQHAPNLGFVILRNVMKFSKLVKEISVKSARMFVSIFQKVIIFELDKNQFS